MKCKVHRVIEGPFPSEDDDEYFNLCLIEMPDGTVENIELYFETMDEAYNMVKFLSTRIEPMVFDLSDQGVDYV